MKFFLSGIKNPVLAKLLLVMRLITCIILGFSLHVSATGLGQGKIDLNFKNTEIQVILNAIEEQTSYRFLYNNELKTLKQKVAINVKKADLEKVLVTLLRNTGLFYQVMTNNLVVINDGKSAAESTLAIITGRVTDEENKPLSGVTVQVKGGAKAVTTNDAGAFSISAEKKDRLVFSYVGYASIEAAVGDKTEFSIILRQEKSNLDEVVVVGYGTVKKKDLTGSVISVKGDEVRKVPASNVLESVQGKLPGADIVRTSGSASSGVSMTVRGNRSISASNGPLIVVDGIIYTSIQDISSNDIQSMEVLKDASSTAIYGSRGANGVILITTKKGSTGKPKISVNSYYGVSTLSDYPKVMDATQYANLRREANRKITLGGVNPVGTWIDNTTDNLIFNNEELTNINNGVNTDYLDLVIHDGKQQEHQVGITAGSENTKVYASLGYYGETAMFKNDDLKRFTARLNLDQTVSRLFKMGMQMQYTHYDIDARTNPLDEASKISSFSKAYDDQGALIKNPNSESARWNPLFDELPGVSINNQFINRTFATAYMDFTPAKGLSIKTNLGTTISTSRVGKFYDVLSLNSRGGSNVASDSAAFNRNLNWENIVSYNKSVGSHTFALTGVASFQRRNIEVLGGRSNNVLLPGSVFYNLGIGNSPTVSSGYAKETLFSLTGRANYSYKGRYLVSLNIRRDESSKYREDNRVGVFPAAAVGWRIIDEPFMKGIKGLNELKFRLSYGITGNDPADAYVTQSVLNIVPNAFSEASAIGLYYNNFIGNRDLRWEKTKAFNAGIDFGFFENRLNGTIDFYRTNTYDLILERSLPATTGAGKVLQNVGKTRNTGLDIGITAAVVQSRDFKFTAGLTFYTNKEEVVSLVNNLNTLPVNGMTVVIGSPVNVLYDYEKIGIWQMADSTAAKTYNQLPGDIKLLDNNKDNKINDLDRKVVGQLTPKWNSGLNLDFTYKGFDLNVFLFARVGQSIAYQYNNRFHLQGRENSAIQNYWTPENASNDFPHPRSTASLTSLLGYTTLANVDGSYFKIRSATIGYNLPASLISKIGVSRVRIYVSGRNLGTFSKIKNYDVERGGSINNPLSRLMLAGMNIDF